MQEKVWRILHRINREIPKDADAEILTTGLLDSFDLSRLIASLEETFDFEVPPTEIIPENFHSINAIVEMIRKSGGVA